MGIYSYKKNGDSVSQGEIIGEVQETPLISHKIMVPYGVNGQLTEIKEGKYTVNENVAKVKTNDTMVDVGLSTWWSVRVPRPVLSKLPPSLLYLLDNVFLIHFSL